MLDQRDLFFQDLVDEYLRGPRFVRRDWLAAEVWESLENPERRIVLLSCEPGWGKSTFLAQLARDHPDWPRYFIRRDQRERLSGVDAKAFLMRIGFQLAALRPDIFETDQIRITIEQRIGQLSSGGRAIGAEIERLIASPFHQTIVRIRQEVEEARGSLSGLRVNEVVGDSNLLTEGELGAMALFDPLTTLARLDPHARVVILVDALDEIQWTDEDHRTDERTILDWLTHSPDLPPNVRFVLTSRPAGIELELMKDKKKRTLHDLKIASADERVTRELQSYAGELAQLQDVQSVLQELGQTPENFIARAVEAADGNIGYLDAIGRGVDNARSFEQERALLRDLLSLKEMPRDLYLLHGFFLKQIRAHPGNWDIRVTDPQTGNAVYPKAWNEVYLPVLSALTVALQPLSLEQIKGLSGTLAELAVVAEAVRWLGQFLDRIGDRYRPYHFTLVEFLTATRTRTSPDTADLYVNSREAHRSLAARLVPGVKSGDVWTDCPDDPSEQGRRDYARLYVVPHLHAAADWPCLFDVLDDARYCRDKLRFDPSTFMLARDLDFGRDAAARTDLDIAASLDLLPTLWRYSLLRASLTSIAALLPPQSFYVMVLVGRQDEATRLAELLADPAARASSFASIAAGYAGLKPPNTPAAMASLRAAWQEAMLIPKVEKRKELFALLHYLSTYVRDQIGELDVEMRKIALGLVAAFEAADERAFALRELCNVFTKPDQAASLAQPKLLEELAQLAESPPDSTNADAVRLEASQAFADQGYFERAAHFCDVIADPGMRVTGLCYLAVCQYRAGQNDAAQAVLVIAEKATALAADVPGALQDLAWARAELADTTAAAEILRRALEMLRVEHDPHKLPIHLTRIGQSLRSLGLIEEASAVLDQVATVAIATIPPTSNSVLIDIPMTAISTATALADLDRWEDALTILRRVHPSCHGRILKTVARCLVRLKFWDKAFELFEHVRSRQLTTRTRTFTITMDDLRATEVLLTIVEGRAREGQWAEARATADRITDDRSEYILALAIIAEQQINDRHTDLAIEILSDITRLIKTSNIGDDKDLALREASRLLTEAKNWSAAEAIAQQAHGSSEHDRVLSAIANSKIDDGDLGGAVAIIERIDDVQARALACVSLASALVPPVGEFFQANEQARVLLFNAQVDAKKIQDPISQSFVLRCVALAFADLHLGDAEAIGAMKSAIDALYRQVRFDTMPTPWCDLVADVGRIGQWQWAAQLLGGFPRSAHFDRVTARLRMAEVAFGTGRLEHVNGLLQEAVQLTRQVEVPIRFDLEASIAREYARLGRLEEALSEAIVSAPALPDACGRVAALFASQGRIAEALGVLARLPGGASQPVFALKALVTSSLKQGDYAMARQIADRVGSPRDRIDVLIQIARDLISSGSDQAMSLLVEAASLLPQIGDDWSLSSCLGEVTSALVAAGDKEGAVRSIQREWRKVSNRSTLLRRLPMAKSIVHLKPDIGSRIATGIDWVEDCLSAS